MTIRRIVSIPDPVLRQVAKPVKRLDEETQTLLDDMLETMYDARGIGLAAVQIGVLLRAVVIDVSPAIKIDESSSESEKEKREEEPPARDPIFLINPEILEVSEERSTFQEGCLSIPGYCADVERPASCKVKFLDRDGKERVMDAEGILATCLQHEIDHLNGVLFIDHISKLKRDMVMKKFSRQRGSPEEEPDRATIG